MPMLALVTGSVIVGGGKHVGTVGTVTLSDGGGTSLRIHQRLSISGVRGSSVNNVHIGELVCARLGRIHLFTRPIVVR